MENATNIPYKRVRNKAWQKRFFRNRLARVAFYVLVLFMFIGLFAPYIANNQPLYVKYKGKTYYPAWQTGWLAKNVLGLAQMDTLKQNGKLEIVQFDLIDWRKMEVDYVVWPLIPFSPTKPDYYNRDYIAPTDEQLMPTPTGNTVRATGKFKHLFGTDNLGRDVLAGIVHGLRTSLFVGFLAMLIATLIGLTLGGVAGFFGDHGLKLTRLAWWLFFPLLFIGYFIAFMSRSTAISEGFETSYTQGFFQLFISLTILKSIPLLGVWLANRFTWGYLGRQVNFPADTLISRAIEIFNALPKLLLILSISAIVAVKSMWLVAVVIGLTAWVEIARITRAELLKIREVEYVQAAKALGIKNLYVLLKHALPNALSVVWVNISLGIAAAILIESGLSFLGIGVPEDAVTLGSMLNMGLHEMDAWWLLVYPGLTIVIILLILNILGEGLRDALDPKTTHKNKS